VGVALLVTFLWSTSWVLIKIGLGEIPALTFAGMRYSLAFAILAPFLLRPAEREAIKSLTGRDWLLLGGLGVLLYTITQGAQFLALSDLPAMTTSLLLNFTTLLVAGLGAWLLRERLSGRQWFGLGVFLCGVVVYFYPAQFPSGAWLGLGRLAVGVTGNALGAVLGRAVNRERRLSPLVVTGVSMGFGAGLLLAAGLAVQGLPRLSGGGWLILGWLAVVNTAVAFPLWNYTLRYLSAFESSVINSTMVIQIAVLAAIFLDEPLGVRAVTGLVLVGLGGILVQMRRHGQV